MLKPNEKLLSRQVVGGENMTIEELDNDFIQICSLCLEDNSLVNEFCRLKNIKCPDMLSPIEKQIDNVCGYDAGMEFMKQFTNFVREFIYIPLVKQQIGG